MFSVFSIYQNLIRPTLHCPFNFSCMSFAQYWGIFMQPTLHFCLLVLVLIWPCELLSPLPPTGVSALQCLVKNLCVHPKAVFILVLFFSIIAHVGNHNRCKKFKLRLKLDFRQTWKWGWGFNHQTLTIFLT